MNLQERETMNEALYISATGMQAQQTQVDTIANNLANMGTIGFKKSRVNFEPLLPRTMAVEQATTATTFKGMGVAVPTVMADFSAGEMKQTQRDLDVAIKGKGFFEVELADGTRGYSRHGSLSVNRDGMLVTAAGALLSAGIQVPTDVAALLISPDGRVQGKQEGSEELLDIGFLEVTQFANEAALQPIGQNVYLATEASGDALVNAPGENGAGTLQQGYLEASNVQMVEELTTLMVAQRAYEANSKVLQAADELLGIVNNLRR
jgi:flagellar basal-body rod protein FlgG